jgi:hypothetical protein
MNDNIQPPSSNTMLKSVGCMLGILLVGLVVVLLIAETLAGKFF